MKREYALVHPVKSTVARVLDIMISPLSARYRARLPHPMTIGTALVLALDHVGDVLLSTPAIAEVRRIHPTARVIVMAGAAGKDVLLGSPDVDEIAVFDAPWFRRSAEGAIQGGGRSSGVRELSRKISALAPDILYDLRGDARHILAARMAGVRSIVGTGPTGLGPLLSAEHAYSRAEHAAESRLSVVRAAKNAHAHAPGSDADRRGAAQGSESKGMRPTWVVSAAERDAAKTLLSGEDRYLVAHVGAGTAGKVWPPECWIALIDLLTADRWRIVLTGSEAERPMAENIARGCKVEPQVLAGRTDLRTLGAVIDGAAMYIGGDTGPTHISAALGTPTVALFGGQSDKGSWGPIGESVMVLTSRKGLSNNGHPMTGIHYHDVCSAVCWMGSLASSS